MKPNRRISVFLNGHSWYYFHAVALLWVLFSVFVENSSVGRYIETRLVHPILFHAREWLDRSPDIHERLKIFALDDSSFSYLGGPRLDTKDLTALIKNIARQNPHAIIIDGLLSDRPGDDLSPLKQLRELQTPVFTGAYLNEKAINFRHHLDLEQAVFQLSHYVENTVSLKDLPPVFDEKFNFHAYGHAREYEGVFSGQGHITYNEEGSLSMFYRLDDNIVLPHIGLFAADHVVIDEEGVWANDHKIPVSNHGVIPINYRPPEKFYEKIRKLRYAMELARKDQPDPQIENGDVVLILLAFATGNTDFHEGSPFGEIPGGLIIASTISDVMSGSWLQNFDITPILIILLASLGVILGINGNASRFWIGGIGISLIYFALVISSFCYFDTIIPWFFPYVAFIGTAFIHFAHVRLQEEFKLFSIERNYFAEKALRLEQESQTAKLEGFLALGKAVQKLLLPEHFQGSFRQYSYGMRYQPHLKMAGDWLYTWQVSNRELRLIIGDVMGKGPSAAIPVASIIGTLKDCETQKLTLEDSLKKINQRLIQMFDFHITSTAAAVSLHYDGRCELYNAGSPGWFLSSAEGIDFFMLRSSPLGLTENIQVAKYSFQLPAKSTLFTFTDGYLEGSRELNRFLRLLQKKKIGDGSLISLHERLTEANETRKDDDDQTLLTVHVA
ncbi:MAG: PP2C family protein-serine/threonine phosphatase [Oligoflexus sp.]